MPPEPTRILFVCLGNLCRSPMAEAVFRHLARERGASDAVLATSAGIVPYQPGGPPHDGTLAVLAAHGIDGSGLVCRGLEHDELARSSRVLAVDRRVLRALERLPIGTARLDLLLAYGTRGELDLDDPFVDGRFEETFARVEDACRGLLRDVLEQRGRNLRGGE